MTNPDASPEVLSLTELAKYLKVGYTHAYTLVRDGHIYAKRSGKRWLIQMKDVRAYLDSDRTEPGPDARDVA
jgi:excisionase family DNA binding protein